MYLEVPYHVGLVMTCLVSKLLTLSLPRPCTLDEPGSLWAATKRQTSPQTCD